MNIRNLSGFIVSYLLLLIGAQAQIFDHAEEGTDTNCMTSLPVNTDSLGNRYKIEKLDLDESIDSVFLVKYNSQDQEIWRIKPLGSEGWQIGASRGGNLYLTASNDYYASPIFVKYDTNGDVIWKRNGLGLPDNPGFIFFNDLKIDNKGDLIVNGSLSGGFSFGESLILKTKSGEINQESSFLIKIDSTGNFKWGKIPQSEFYGYVRPLSSFQIDKFNNAYFCASFSTPTSIDDQRIFPIEGGNGLTYLVTKFNESGTLRWLTLAGPDLEPNKVGQICLDDSNKIYIKGKLAMTQNALGYFGETILGPYNTGGDEILSYHSYVARLNQTRAPGVIYRINCGGPELADSPINWSKDTQPEPSSYFYYTPANHTTGSLFWNGVNNTGAPKNIFGPQRYMISWGTRLEYDFPVTQGLYRINLFFAEKPHQEPYEIGKRVFDVEVGNQKVLENFDIYATAKLDANKQSFIIYVPKDTIQLKFIRKVGNPQINGIEIESFNYTESILSTNVKSPIYVSDAKNNGYVFVDDEQLTIKTGDNENGQMQVAIYDYIGKVYYEEKVTANQGMVVIPFNAFNSKPNNGLYFIKAGDTTYKFITK